MLYLAYLLLKNTYKTKIIKFKSKKLKVLVADSFLKRAIGLGYRKQIKEDGMLFIFEKSGKYTITTLNMRFPIEVFWIDEKGIIKEKVLAKPLSFYYPKSKSKFILELKPNIIKAKIGEKLEF
ncbi:MAG: DUF192 domain-containing protein [Candidatus Micrarchaeia archaeon]